MIWTFVSKCFEQQCEIWNGVQQKKNVDQTLYLVCN